MRGPKLSALKGCCWFLRVVLVLALPWPVHFAVEIASQSTAEPTENTEPVQRALRPFATLTAEGWATMAGGPSEGTWWNYLLDFGLEVDAAKLGGWKGGSFLAQFHWVKNSRDDASFADRTGGFNPVSGIMAENHFRLFNLYYRQGWLEDRFVLKLGQLAADDDFMTSDYTGLFANSAFGALPSQVGLRLASCCDFSTAFPIYPVAAPGLFMAARPREGVYAQTGLYYGRPGVDRESNYGFDWVNRVHPELGLFAEGGRAYQLAGRAATIRVGTSHHTGRLEDFAAMRAGYENATRQQVPNFYAIHDLCLSTDAQGNARLGLFCRGGVTPQPDASQVAAYADFGLNLFEPLPGRKEDLAGVALSYTRFGREFQKSDPSRRMPSGQTTIELTYRASLLRNLWLQGDVQFLFDPLASAGSVGSGPAIVLGLRGRVSF